jgi:deoxycytidylate deaminase
MKDKFIRKYMRLAKVIAEDQNPCLSRKVGVVVVDPETNGIVGAGYNGPPENTPHCTDVEFLENFFWPQLSQREIMQVLAYYRNVKDIDRNPINHSKQICEFLSDCNKCPRNILGYSSGQRPELCSCQHAERNALSKLPIPAKGLTMFCWCGVPCIQCTGSIINAGIKEVHCLKQKDYQSVARWLFGHGNTSLIEHNLPTLELE